MNRSETIEAAGVWREYSHRLLGLRSRATRASGKKMRKDPLLLVVGDDVVVHSICDVLLYGRKVRSTYQRHCPQSIGLIDSVRSERFSRGDGVRHCTHRGDHRTRAALILHLIDLDGKIRCLLDSIIRVIELEWPRFDDMPDDQRTFRKLVSIRQKNHLHGLGGYHIPSLCLRSVFGVGKYDGDC